MIQCLKKSSRFAHLALFAVPLFSALFGLLLTSGCSHAIDVVIPSDLVRTVSDPYFNVVLNGNQQSGWVRSYTLPSGLTNGEVQKNKVWIMQVRDYTNQNFTYEAGDYFVIEYATMMRSLSYIEAGSEVRHYETVKQICQAIEGPWVPQYSDSGDRFAVLGIDRTDCYQAKPEDILHNNIVIGSPYTYVVVTYRATVQVLKSETSFIEFAPGALPIFGPVGDYSDFWSFYSLEVNSISHLRASTSQAHDDAQQQLQATHEQTDAINNQTKQEQDQYDQEKQEEADRENSTKDEGNNLLGIFNITLLNPFAGIWEMFNPGGCTSIPTIASWIHSDNTTYCSWWPQSIRATLTPVFSLASMMLLFGFVMRWLGGSANFHLGGD